MPLRAHSSTIVAWAADGQAFFIHDEQIFITDILPKYNFKASKIASFQRNLNIYGFQRMVKGPHAGGYVHPLFHRDMDTVVLSQIARRETTVKGGEPLRPLKGHPASASGSRSGSPSLSSVSPRPSTSAKLSDLEGCHYRSRDVEIEVR